MSGPAYLRVLVAGVALCVAASCSSHHPNSARAPASRLVHRRCEARVSSTTDCYWLEVPENRNDPATRSIRLWVAVDHEEGAPADASPLVSLSGGPGDSSSNRFLRGQMHDIGTPRVTVVIDQRGTGRSRPRLDCPTFAMPLDATHPWTERLAAARRAVQTCAGQYRRAHIDLAGYNTPEDAADIVDLRRLLGYHQWLLRSVSYGGRVAQEVLRQDPKGVAAALLDSPVSYRAQGAASLVAARTRRGHAARCHVSRPTDVSPAVTRPF